MDETREINSDAVRELLAERRRTPDRFRATGGFERLLSLLQIGSAPAAFNDALAEHADHAGDLLWTVVQLDDVAPFVTASIPYLQNPDKATTAYAMEKVLRGARTEMQLRAALDHLASCDIAVCEHAVRTLVGEGLIRIVEIFQVGGWPWAATLAESLLLRSFRFEILEDLISDSSRERQIVGDVLATLAWEGDRRAAKSLRCSSHDWIRDYGRWLENGQVLHNATGA